MVREIWGSIPGRFIPKTQKIVHDAALLNTQHYKVSVIYSHHKYAYIHIYMFMQHHNDTIIDRRTMIKTQ